MALPLSKVKGRNLLFRKHDTRIDFLSPFASSVEALVALIWTTDCLVWRMLFESWNLCLKLIYKRGPLAELSCRMSSKCMRWPDRQWSFRPTFISLSVCDFFTRSQRHLSIVTEDMLWILKLFLEVITKMTLFLKWLLKVRMGITVKFIFCIHLWAYSPKGKKLTFTQEKNVPIFVLLLSVPKHLAIQNCKGEKFSSAYRARGTHFYELWMTQSWQLEWG